MAAEHVKHITPIPRTHADDANRPRRSAVERLADVSPDDVEAPGLR